MLKKILGKQNGNAGITILITAFVIGIFLSSWFTPVMNDAAITSTISEAITYLSAHGYRAFADGMDNWTVTGNINVAGNIYANDIIISANKKLTKGTPQPLVTYGSGWLLETLTNPTDAETVNFRTQLALSSTDAHKSQQFSGLCGDLVVKSTNTKNYTNAMSLFAVDSAIVTETGSTGTITGLANYVAYYLNNGMTVDKWYGMYIYNPGAVATINYAYGIYIEEITKGGILNYGLYSLAPTYLSGALTVGADVSWLPYADNKWTLGSDAARLKLVRGAIGNFNDIQFGTYTAGAATDSAGYITITDAFGNPRRLMVQAP